MYVTATYHIKDSCADVNSISCGSVLHDDGSLNVAGLVLLLLFAGHQLIKNNLCGIKDNLYVVINTTCPKIVQVWNDFLISCFILNNYLLTLH